MMRIILLVLTAIAVGTVSLTAYAKPDDQLRRVEQELNDKKHQQDALTAAAEAASKNLDDLRQRMIDSTQSLQQKQSEQETLESRLNDLTEQIAAKSVNAEQEHQQLIVMISALVEIASRPAISLFLQDHHAADYSHRRLLLQAILPRLKEHAEAAIHDLVTLVDLQTELAQQRRLVAAAADNLKKQQSDLDQMIATRQGFLQRTEAEKAETAQHLAELADQAHDLRQLMEKVVRQNAAPPKPMTAQGTMALHWPVSGSVHKHFGDQDADGVTSEGVTFAAPSGAPVVAPLAGRVVFVGPFRGYGQVMILQHDNGYHSFLSGFGRIDAEMGQEVTAGEPLGVLPVKAGSKPELYFEWRQGDQPVEPPWSLKPL